MTKTQNSKNIKDIIASCPVCHEKTNVSTSNPHRPFCSERCKIIDLGNWASESYTIPISEQSQPEDYDPDTHS